MSNELRALAVLGSDPPGSHRYFHLPMHLGADGIISRRKCGGRVRQHWPRLEELGGGHGGSARGATEGLGRHLADGSVVTQCCHASVAAIWAHKADPDTLLYRAPSNIDSMHKVKSKAQIRNSSEKLEAGGVAHKLWLEQPENIPTCLATKPYPKSFVSSSFKKLKLHSCWMEGLYPL